MRNLYDSVLQPVLNKLVFFFSCSMLHLKRLALVLKAFIKNNPTKSIVDVRQKFIKIQLVGEALFGNLSSG